MPAMPSRPPKPPRMPSPLSSPASGESEARGAEPGKRERQFSIHAEEVTKDSCASLSIFLADEGATIELAQRLAACLKPGMVIYLLGDLGAGKTTLVRGMLNALGYTGRVKSPTYTLVEPYHIAGLDLRHFDLYRLQDEEEWEAAGFRDEFDGYSIFFIEWPEHAPGLIPQADIKIYFEILPHGRNVVIQTGTTSGEECLKRL